MASRTTRGPGRIAISAHRVNGALHLTVADSGPGFGGSPHRGRGMGLSNVRARLAQLYGEAQTRDDWSGRRMVARRSGIVGSLPRTVTRPVRALIVDDEPLARDGLRMLLGGTADSTWSARPARAPRR